MPYFIKKYLPVTILFLLVTLTLSGQEWIVPNDRKGKLSPFPFSDATRKAGEQLFSKNCKACHGTPGMGNFLQLVPPPGDPATDKIQRNKDGEIFYKVTEGHGQMPSFKNVLNSNEIWNIISYIRSFNKSYKQQISSVVTSSAYPGAEIKVTLSFNQRDSAVRLNAIAVKDKVIVPVTSAAVKLFIHRTFGLLQVDEEKMTDDKGIALFRFPVNLPGDSAGNIKFSARLTNEEIFGAVSKDTTLCAGEKVTPVSLVTGRAMWNVVRKAPVWVILTFSSGLLLVWSFIIYVLLKLRNIFIIGKFVLQDSAENEK